MNEKDAGQFIEVRYRNGREGLVDDVTLNELILSKSITQFYRPFEGRWIDVHADPVRQRANGYIGPERRAHVKEEQVSRPRPRRLLGRLFRRRGRTVTPQPLSARQWFARGLVLLFNDGDCEGAIRAFARSIQLGPTYERAYLNRGLAYETLDNLQQAVEDYTRAIDLAPDDAKLFYVRGLALRRLGMDAEAINDLTRAANLGYWPAHDVLKSIGRSL